MKTKIATATWNDLFWSSNPNEWILWAAMHGILTVLTVLGLK